MSDTIRCEVCKKWEGHIIAPHLREEHPKVGLMMYAKDNPIASKHGFWALRENGSGVYDLRERSIKKKVSEVFGLPEWDGKDQARRWVNREISIFESPIDLTPAIDDNYIFHEPALKRVLFALELDQRNNAWIHGYSGTGKTELCKQVAARTNYGLLHLAGDKHAGRRHLIGDVQVKDRATYFLYGILPRAMREGHILLIDEIDLLPDTTVAAIRSVLDFPSTLVILENGGEVIRATPNFRAMATANTAGSGDESGLFVGTNALSAADRQRFQIWVPLDFMPPETEKAMIQKRFKLGGTIYDRFYQVVSAIRNKHKVGQFEESFSPREFINWVEKFTMIGDAMEAADMCFLARYANESSREAVALLIKAAFDLSRPPETAS